MAEISLGALDEVIRARRTLHGGAVGAPRLLADGSREGGALNKACVVLLTASLQAYIEEVFVECSVLAFGDFEEPQAKRYRKTWDRWGNPSPDNIVNLFRRLGVDDIFHEFSWQGQSTATLKANLNTMNQVRNRIAHGDEIRVDGNPFQLTLNRIVRWRNIAERFGERFDVCARWYFEDEE